MVKKVLSAALDGLNSYVVTVEIDIANGLPGIDMVGNLGSEVKESAERVKVALKNIGYSLPAKRITINLSPAGIKKCGTAFDLPIAIGLLEAMEVIHIPEDFHYLAFGEMGLDGGVQHVKGVLPMVMNAKEMGIEVCIVPLENKNEGSVIQGIDIIGVEKMDDIIDFFQNGSLIDKNKEISEKSTYVNQHANSNTIDFNMIIGQPLAKRAAEIAAAGFHNLLFSGPPGTGKSMIAKAIGTILPPMTEKEMLETSKIYSISGLLNNANSFITSRPFQGPHHTITKAAFVGGGMNPKPGVISLANHGVLFLDEFPEFNRETLDLLRQPIEEGSIHIVRKMGSFSFPCNFMLVAAMNPCPCGFYPNKNLCNCSDKEVHRYVKSISGPLLNRIDLSVSVLRSTYEDIKWAGQTQNKEESSEEIQKRVMKAFEIQKARNGAYVYNSRIPVSEIDEICTMTDKAEKLMEQYYSKKNLSLRGYHRMLRVGRTIADLEGSEDIMDYHLLEAANYRGMLDRV